MKIKRIKSFIKKILLVDEGPKPLFLRNQPLPKNSNLKNEFEVCNFGDLNKDCGVRLVFELTNDL